MSRAKMIETGGRAKQVQCIGCGIPVLMPLEDVVMGRALLCDVCLASITEEIEEEMNINKMGESII